MEKNLLSFFLIFAFVAGVLYATSFYQNSNAADITTTIKLGICGNNVREGGEQCDGNDLAGKSCSFFGFAEGTLSCDLGCEFDTSQCKSGGGMGGGTGIPQITLKEIAQSLQAVDFNNDSIVNITDLSILLYYFGKSVSTNPASARYDLNGDGLVNITDISILLYYWR